MQIQNVNDIHYGRLSAMDKLALAVTQKVGTFGFFIIIFCWTLAWLTWNIIGPKDLRFDPYPAFVLWIFISNLIQIHLMPLILIGQNIQTRHADLRAEQEYLTTLHILSRLENLENPTPPSSSPPPVSPLPHTLSKPQS